MPQTIGVMSSFSDHEFRRLNVHMLTDPGPYGRDSPFLVFPITPSKTALRGVSKPLRAMATKNGHQPLAHFHWKQEASRIHLHLSLSTRQRILSSYTTSFPSMRTNLREDVIGPTGRRALRLLRSYGCGVSSGIWILLLGCSLPAQGPRLHQIPIPTNLTIYRKSSRATVGYCIGSRHRTYVRDGRRTDSCIHHDYGR
jgi:hypothetical protein